MVELLVTFMEMRHPPLGMPQRHSDSSVTVRPERLEAVAYLALYGDVGAPLHWDTRYRLTEGALSVVLANLDNEIHVLRLDGAPVGFCEIEHAPDGDAEVKHFGLVAAVQGRGLGPALLDTAVRHAWRRQPRRIWLHTDEWDHPSAVATYRKVGFAITERRRQDVTDL